MRSLRTDLLLALGAVAVLLTLFGLSQGCRPERPDTPDKGTAPEVQHGPEAGLPDEPLPELRKKLQSDGYTVVSVDKSVFFTWLDGELRAGPDLELELRRLLDTGKQMKIALLFAEADASPWTGIVAMRERMDRTGIPYKMIFADYPGLGPAVAAGGGEPPQPPGDVPPPPDGPPSPPPGGDGGGTGGGH